MWPWAPYFLYLSFSVSKCSGAEVPWISSPSEGGPWRPLTPDRTAARSPSSERGYSWKSQVSITDNCWRGSVTDNCWRGSITECSMDTQSLATEQSMRVQCSNLNCSSRSQGYITDSSARSPGSITHCSVKPQCSHTPTFSEPAPEGPYYPPIIERSFTGTVFSRGSYPETPSSRGGLTSDPEAFSDSSIPSSPAKSFQDQDSQSWQSFSRLDHCLS